MSATKVAPVVDVAKITVRHAERILDDMRGPDDYGTVVIDGINVEWWADHQNVWFYNPGDDGENTIKRFDVERNVTAVNS